MLVKVNVLAKCVVAKIYLIMLKCPTHSTAPSRPLYFKDQFWLFWISAGSISLKSTFATSHLGQKQQLYSSGLHSDTLYFA